MILRLRHNCWMRVRRSELEVPTVTRAAGGAARGNNPTGNKNTSVKMTVSLNVPDLQYKTSLENGQLLSIIYPLTVYCF